MRLHVVGLPHTEVSPAYDWCAYTAKIRRLRQMLAMYDHKMELYTSSGEDRRRWFGSPTWNIDQVFGQWDATATCWVEMNADVIERIRERIEPQDAIGIIGGACQGAVADAFPDHLILEWGIGYVGVLPQSFRCYESNAHRQYVHGYFHDDDGRFFDTVIPNAFNVRELEDPVEYPGDYVLFLGRHTHRKGLPVVAEIAKHYDVVAVGQGDEEIPGTEHLGVVMGRRKADLIAHAKAVVVPSLYLEPFGGIHVEAMMCGTPVITTDFGVFPETVTHGIDGYRANLLHEFVDAVAMCDDLDRNLIAARARARFSLEAVAPRYDAWFQRLEHLRGDGWYARCADSPASTARLSV